MRLEETVGGWPGRAKGCGDKHARGRKANIEAGFGHDGHTDDRDPPGVHVSSNTLVCLKGGLNTSEHAHSWNGISTQH